MHSNDVGDMASYSLSSDVCIALTNFHIRNHPLRQTDSELYLQIMANYERKGKEMEEHQKEKYASRRAIRMVQQA
jgi:hypothetical protein